MSVPDPRPHPVLRAPVLPFSVVVFLVGCAAPIPEVSPEAEIAARTGLAEPIRFRAEPDPLDVAVPRPDALPLAVALERCLHHDPRLQVALARVRSAVADAEQEAVLPNPIVDVIVRFPERGGRPEIEVGAGVGVLSLLTRPARTRAAGERLRASAEAAVVTALDVVAEVRTCYAVAAAGQRVLPVLAQRHAVLDRLRGIAGARVSAGEGTRSEVVALEAKVVELEVETSERECAARTARLELARLVGAPHDAANWQLDAFSAPAAPAASVQELAGSALERRPEVLLRRAELRALGEEATRVPAFEPASLGVVGERTDHRVVGPSASFAVPLFDFGGAHRAKLDAQRAVVRHELLAVQREIVETVRSTHATLGAKLANLARVREAWVPLLEKRHAAAEASWKVGEADVTSLLVAEDEVLAARLRVVDLEVQATTAGVRLERALGGRP